MIRFIEIKKKDGEQKNFMQEISRCTDKFLAMKLENEFVTIEDEWGVKTIYPAADIDEIKQWETSV